MWPYRGPYSGPPTNRGACYFAQKAANAAAAGAKLLIIVNNNTDNPSEIITMAAPTDGSVDLNSINIPTIMISSSDGNHLKARTNNGTTISFSPTLNVLQIGLPSSLK